MVLSLHDEIINCVECVVNKATLGGLWCDTCRAAILKSEWRWYAISNSWNTSGAVGSDKAKPVRLQRDRVRTSVLDSGG